MMFLYYHIPSKVIVEKINFNESKYQVKPPPPSVSVLCPLTPPLPPAPPAPPAPRVSES